VTVIAIAVAGALGALARYGLEGVVSNRWPGAFPWGTFVVNVTGAFALGLLFVLLSERVTIDASVRSALTIGFLGAYTTFSTLSFETYRLFEDGADWLALAKSHGSLAAGLVAV
jgi:CrcB protein